ncbi:MAG: META domain-containing protein [Chloroflexi bacterium]|nr:MAG: META domain-containing protein [Chloroflexota bacterium]
MSIKQQLKKSIILFAALITLVMAACTPTTGDSLPPVDGNDGGADDVADAVLEEVETAVPPTAQPEEPEAPAQPEEPNLAVHNMVWILQSYAGQSVISDTNVSVEFSPDGQLSGSAGCNNYFGSYQLDGNNLTIDGVGSTEMWCEGLMDQEMAFLSMLMNAASIKIDDNVLTIETAEGDLVFADDVDQVVDELTQDEETIVEIEPADGVVVSPENENTVPGRYIVMLNPGLFNEDGETADGKTVVVLADELVALTEGRLSSVLEIINGFVVEGLSKEDVRMLSENPMVMAIEQDRLVSIDPIEMPSIIAEKTVFVGSEKVDCVGVGPQECLLVKEGVDGEWELFYDEIVGFTWEPGYEYELRVRIDQVQNPPADGSSILWTLLDVVGKKTVSD